MVFIAIAERSDLIHLLGRWVFTTACQQLKQWDLITSHPKLSISINVSPRQFDDDKLFDRIPRILNENQLEANRVAIEITETAVLECSDAAQERFKFLKALGLKIYLDDFGTGYSSLSHISGTPLDAIKIDRSFVDKACSVIKDQQLLHGMLLLSEQMGIFSVAEGIETQEQLDLLVDKGCRLGQGYLLAKPMPAKEFTQFLERQPSFSS